MSNDNGFVEEPLASALRGLAVTGICLDIGDHAGIENALPIVCGIKAAIEVEVGVTNRQSNWTCLQTTPYGNSHSVPIG